jgi:hypothetical protein
MSYVLQNFFNINQKITLIPRIKFLIILNNLKFIFFLFKNQLFIYFNKKFNTFNLNYFGSFIKYFYSHQINFLINKINLNFVGPYENNLFKSIIFHNLHNLLTPLDENEKHKLNSNNETASLKKNILFNSYFLSHKLINNIINKKFYKNFFFFLMLHFSNIWIQQNNFFKFYLNFFFVNYELTITPFYNGYFLHIYNF